MNTPIVAMKLLYDWVAQILKIENWHLNCVDSIKKNRKYVNENKISDGNIFIKKTMAKAYIWNWPWYTEI